MKFLPLLLRVTVLAIVVWMLTGWQPERSADEPAQIAFLLDDSQSMSLTDLPQRVERFAAVREQVAKIVADNDAKSQPQVVVYSVSELQPLSGASATAALERWQATADRSPLGDALLAVAQAQRGQPTAAVVLLTDGNGTQGVSLSNAAEQLRSQGLPLYVVGIGREEPEVDLQVVGVQAPQQAFAGDAVRFEVQLKATGPIASATVQLQREGADQPLAEAQVSFTNSPTATAVLTWEAKEPGTFRFDVLATPDNVPNEPSLANNRRPHAITVRAFDLQVLLAWGTPHYEFRYLESLLEREFAEAAKDGQSKPQLTTFLQDADLAYASTKPHALRTFPAGRQALDAFDVIILGDLNPDLIGRQTAEDLKAFVEERGGGLMIVAGSHYGSDAWNDTPLAALLPFKTENADGLIAQVAGEEFDQPLRFRPTPLGEAAPLLQLAGSPAANAIIWQQLPTIYWHAKLPAIKPGVAVLAEVVPEDQPPTLAEAALTTHYFGAGNVLFQATDETHRWRFRVGDKFFGRYWRQIVRHLGQRKLLVGTSGIELATDREEYEVGENVQLQVRFRQADDIPPEDSIEIEIQANGGLPQIVLLTRDNWEPGLFRGQWTATNPGTYRWKLPAMSEREAASLVVRDTPTELAVTTLQMAALQQAAELGNGKYVSLEALADLVPTLTRSTPTAAPVPSTLPPWNNVWLAALVVAMLTGEWWLRIRRSAT